METIAKKRLLKSNTETLAAFLVVGLIIFFLSNSTLLFGFFSGGLFCGINFYLLIVVVTLFLHPGRGKFSAYGIVILKSLIFFGGLAVFIRITKVNPAGFLAGFGIYTMIIVIREFITMRRISHA